MDHIGVYLLFIFVYIFQRWAYHDISLAGQEKYLDKAVFFHMPAVKHLKVIDHQSSSLDSINIITFSKAYLHRKSLPVLCCCGNKDVYMVMVTVGYLE